MYKRQDIDLNHVTLFRDELADYMQREHVALRDELLASKISDEMASKLKDAIGEFKKSFLTKHPNKEVLVDVSEQAEYTKAAQQAEEDEGQE